MPPAGGGRGVAVGTGPGPGAAKGRSGRFPTRLETVATRARAGKSSYPPKVYTAAFSGNHFDPFFFFFFRFFQRGNHIVDSCCRKAEATRREELHLLSDLIPILGTAGEGFGAAELVVVRRQRNGFDGQRRQSPGLAR